jgi:hypothetical protein
MRRSSFNDINMWYKPADPARTCADAGCTTALGSSPHFSNPNVHAEPAGGLALPGRIATWAQSYPSARRSEHCVWVPTSAPSRGQGCIRGTRMVCFLARSVLSRIFLDLGLQLPHLVFIRCTNTFPSVVCYICSLTGCRSINRWHLYGSLFIGIGLLDVAASTGEGQSVHGLLFQGIDLERPQPGSFQASPALRAPRSLPRVSPRAAPRKNSSQDRQYDINLKLKTKMTRTEKLSKN